MPRFDIPFTINGETQTITATGNRTIRAGSKNYWYAAFSFVDEDFDDLSHLSATFSNEPYIRNRGRAKVVPLEFDEANVTPNIPPEVTRSVTVYHTASCRIPWEVLTRKGKVYVGIFAGDMLVTNEAEIDVTFAAPTLGEESQPTAGWYERFEADLAAKQDKLTAGKNITITDKGVISAEGGGSVTVDSELSLVSENPVQNKILTAALNDKIEVDDPVTNILFEMQDETTATVTGYTFEGVVNAVQQQGRVDVYLAGDAADRSTWTRIIPIYISSDTMYFTTPTLFVESSIPALIFCRVDKTQGGSCEITYLVTQLQRLVALDSTPTFGSDVPVESNGIYLALQDKYEKPSGGIPKTDLASGVQSSLDKADSALQNHQSLAAYRTAEAQDLIDGAQDTAIAAKYTKPSGGIPKTDLASAVQTSLGKADTAYQKPSGGIPADDLASGVIPSVPSAATATPSALGAAAVGSSSKYAREDHVHAMPSASDVGASPAITEVTVSTAGAVTQALDAGKIYHFTGALTSLTITFNAASGVPAQYHFDFTEPSTAFDPVLPNGVKMPDGWTWEADTRYEVDILNGYGVAIGWAVSA